MKNMRTGTRGISLIKEFEGFKNKAYRCPAGVWTIGYGTTRNVRSGMTITLTEGERMLQDDLVKFERAVNRLVTVPLTQNQFDALVSFVYNVGEGAFGRSTLLSLLNRGQYSQVETQLMRWNRAGGQVLAGLTRRRAAEARLFNTK